MGRKARRKRNTTTRKSNWKPDLRTKLKDIILCLSGLINYKDTSLHFAFLQSQKTKASGQKATGHSGQHLLCTLLTSTLNRDLFLTKTNEQKTPTQQKIQCFHTKSCFHDVTQWPQYQRHQTSTWWFSFITNSCALVGFYPNNITNEVKFFLFLPSTEYQGIHSSVFLSCSYPGYT